MESPKTRKKQQTPDSDKKNFLKNYALAFELVIMNAALIIGGYFLDDYLSSSPVAILLATFLSMACTIWLLLKSIQ